MCDGGIGLLADAIEGLVMNILVGFHDFEESATNSCGGGDPYWLSRQNLHLLAAFLSQSK